MDWELLLVVAFIGLGVFGAVFGVLAGYYYFRFERQSDAPRIPTAMVTLGLQFALFFALPTVRYEALLPTILTAVIFLASILIVWLGFKAQSRSGRRIVVAGIFTFGSFFLKIVFDYAGR